MRTVRARRSRRWRASCVVWQRCVDALDLSKLTFQHRVKLQEPSISGCGLQPENICCTLAHKCSWDGNVTATLMPILRSAKTLDRIATGYWAESAHRGRVGVGVPVDLCFRKRARTAPLRLNLLRSRQLPGNMSRLSDRPSAGLAPNKAS